MKRLATALTLTSFCLSLRPLRKFPRRLRWLVRSIWDGILVADFADKNVAGYAALLCPMSKSMTMEC